MKTSRILNCFLFSNVMFWVVATTALTGLLAYTYALPQVLAISGWGLMVGLFVVAGCIWLTGFIGCCGGVRINMFCMRLFMFLAGTLFLVELGFFLYVGSDGVGQIGKFDDPAYFVSLGIEERYSIQTRFDCCGVNGVQDYVENSVAPDYSCFTETVSGGIITYTAITTGCKSYMSDFYVISFATQCALIGFAIYLQIFGMGMGYLLMGRIKRQRVKRDAEAKLKAEKAEKRRLKKDKQKTNDDDDKQKLIASSASLSDEHVMGKEDDLDRCPSGPEIDIGTRSNSRNSSVVKSSQQSTGSRVSLDPESGRLTPVEK